MIPLLGVLVLNRGDLLLRMVDSIDYPIDKLAIVQNGCEPDVVDAIDQIMDNTGGIFVDHPKTITIKHNLHHLLSYILKWLKVKYFEGCNVL